MYQYFSKIYLMLVIFGVVSCLFWVLCLIHVFISFILRFSHGTCLFHASLALMSSRSDWFSYSLCHVLFGGFLSCVQSCFMIELFIYRGNAH